MSPIFSECCEYTKETCQLRKPLITWFEGNGIFSHIKLPIKKHEKVPDELFKYICCHKYPPEGIIRNWTLQVVVKRLLNELVMEELEEKMAKLEIK